MSGIDVPKATGGMTDGVPGSVAGGPGAGAARGTLAGAVRAVSGVTFISRLLGLVRDVLIVRLFGATAIGSAFTAAFLIPNVFRRLFGEGALSAAFLPEYAAAESEDKERAGRFATLVLLALGIVTGLLTAVLELALLLGIWLLPHDEDRRLSLELIMVMLPFMPAICGAAILGGMLQVHGRFGPAASGPLLLNAFVIGTAAWHVFSGAPAGRSVAFALGIATVLSGFTQAAWFAWLLRKHMNWRRPGADAWERARRALRRFGPVVIGLGTLQLNTLGDTLIAMWPIWVGATMLGATYPLDESSNIILSAATRLYQFPLGVFGIAVATAVFPMLSRAARDGEAFTGVLRRGLRLSLFISLPATVGLALTAPDLVRVLYGAGVGGSPGSARGFDASDLARTSSAVLGFSLGVWAYSLNHVFTRAFYAQGDTRTPMLVSVSSVALNLCLNLTLIWFLREAGLAWATSIAAIAQSAALILLARRRLRCEGIIDAELLGGVARSAGAAAVMGAAVWGLLELLRPVGANPAVGANLAVGVNLEAGANAAAGAIGLGSWTGALLRVAAATGAGIMIYTLGAVLLKSAELRWLLSRRPAMGRVPSDAPTPDDPPRGAA